MTRKYNFIIFGASAYTGQFVTEELVSVTQEAENKNLTWAIAGRSHNKLNQVLQEASRQTGLDLTKVEIVIADINNVESLKKMARLTMVIMTIVGPYTLYGENVVKACIAEGTSCVDLSGEANFLEKMQIIYHDAALKSGAYIVGSCGFDSIPCDLGVACLQNNFGGELNSVEMFLETKFSGIPPKLHYGTWYSAVNFFEREYELQGYRKILFSKPVPQPKFPLENKGLLHYSKTIKGWCVPFPGVDESIVRRSQYYLYNENEIRQPVQIQAYVKMPLILCILALLAAFVFKFLSQFKIGRHVLIHYPRLCTLGMVSHEGSSRKHLKTLRVKITLAGEGWAKGANLESLPELKKKLVVTGSDPAYSSTAAILVQSALTIVKESNKLPSCPGVYSPGAAFAQTSLTDRLNARGVTFTLTE